MKILNVSSTKLIFFLLFTFSMSAYADDTCLKWFQTSGVKPDSSGCLMSCDLIPKDMATFACADRCGEFCKTKKCASDPYWKNKLKNAGPKNWNLPTERPANWTDLEIEQIMAILNQLPDQLKDLPIDGIFRMKLSVDIANPASTSKDGKDIVIYDRAFHSPFWSLSRVVTHELGHALLQSMSQKDQSEYSKSLGWSIKVGNSESRLGDLISSTAKEDSNEDFAENFSFFLLDRDSLKSKVPKAYDWFTHKLATSFKLKEGCR